MQLRLQLGVFGERLAEVAGTGQIVGLLDGTVEVEILAVRILLRPRGQHPGGEQQD